MPSARAKQKLLWNFQSSRHHCHRHCHCITAAAIKGYLPPRLVPSSRRHRLTDTSSVYRRYSHRRIARGILPPSFRRQLRRQRREWFRRSEYVHGRRHGKCSYQSAEVPPSLPSLPIRFNTMPNSIGKDESDKSAFDTANVRANVTAVRKRAGPATPSTSASKAKKPRQPGKKKHPQRNKKNVPHRLLVTMPVRPHLLHRVFNSLLRRNKKN